MSHCADSGYFTKPQQIAHGGNALRDSHRQRTDCEQVKSMVHPLSQVLDLLDGMECDQ